jgi:hypothetical protein
MTLMQSWPNKLCAMLPSKHVQLLDLHKLVPVCYNMQCVSQLQRQITSTHHPSHGTKPVLLLYTLRPAWHQHTHVYATATPDLLQALDKMCAPH